MCVSCINPLVFLSPQYFEVPFDSNMNRTKNRPLVRGQIRYRFLSLCLLNSFFPSWYEKFGTATPSALFIAFKKTVSRVYRRRETQQLSMSWSSARYWGRQPSNTTWQQLSLPSCLLCNSYWTNVRVCYCSQCSLTLSLSRFAEGHFSSDETWSNRLVMSMHMCMCRQYYNDHTLKLL